VYEITLGQMKTQIFTLSPIIGAEHYIITIV
jgi:hypothetical protein